jgi:hypothetical protein
MNSDLLLVIDHRETSVRMDGRALRIDQPQAPPEHVPLGLVGLVVVHGSPMVSCDVWRALAERNIPAVLQACSRAWTQCPDRRCTRQHHRPAHGPAPRRCRPVCRTRYRALPGRR